MDIPAIVIFYLLKAILDIGKIKEIVIRDIDMEHIIILVLIVLFYLLSVKAQT